ncbi:aminotransferase class I/II-fold pyridoxal phosphate-dependent enzyme [Amycolatopsis sp. CA-230715]|uniref:aminotransferase class I/II-fold pyridoxal phosphate-dependent enzyme n=1 Tax=Amycolatopsis sp. CA-230715 TaxID=2745196 RepID=UPI001C00CAD9|nr:aminotransferase class I/II-fold pyridoxal phosphate-dependent enzyme [Amycolatopsis sp. CA-230715]QWF83930.1 8-amino-7-oxononanoate synthase [Amycolatopsis sp. CA-230715]
MDFTSSLYLGMRHPSGELPGWTAVTTGRPAALGIPRAAVAVGSRLAALQGTERALLTRSTLHAFSDCLDALARPGTAIVLDGGAYPIARWAVQRAIGTGCPVVVVRHHDPVELAGALRRISARGLRPLVVADGLCGGCGRRFPLATADSALRSGEGLLLLDDTQALGLHGARPRAAHPFGSGGGGSLRRSGLAMAPRIVLVASMAKAFGAPVAAISGPAALLAKIWAEGGSVTHSSPPSAADIRAAARALDRNETEGDGLRARLAARIRQLRDRCAARGPRLRGGLFPVQRTPVVSVAEGRRMLETLDRAGIRAVLTRDCGGRRVLALVVTAAHSPSAVRAAADAVTGAWFANVEECHV